MFTPWGNSDSEKRYERGLTWVGTPSHGGFLIGKAYARKHLTGAAIAEGESFGQYLAFEEDCDAAIVLYELPATREGFSDVTDTDLLLSLSRWHPKYLAARGHPGDGGTIQHAGRYEHLGTSVKPAKLIAGLAKSLENQFTNKEKTMSMTPNFPQSLCEAYKPQTLAEFCGLEKQRKILSNLAANPRPATLLFEGASGTGKTSCAYAFARAIGGAEIHHIGSQEANIENLKNIVMMCNYVPLSGGMHVVIIDEVDRASAAVQLYLLSKFDGTEPVPATLFILTCNESSGLETRFLSRCIRLPRFTAYGAGDSIRQLLARIWRERAGNTPEPDYTSFSTSNVREALNMMETTLLSI